MDNYIPTGQYCYDIGGFYVCTNDKYLARIYFDAMRIVKFEGKGSSCWYYCLDLLVYLDYYAESKGIPEDNAELAGIKQSVSDVQPTLLHDTYSPERDTPIIESAMRRLNDLEKAYADAPAPNLRTPGKEFPFKEEYANFETVINRIKEIGDIHKKSDRAIYPETTEAEEEVLHYVDLYLEEDPEMYAIKAMLEASNNWDTFEIVRPDQYRAILLEGIDKGALAPENAFAWSMLGLAAQSNDPQEFMTDIDRYYDLLATAVEHGNTDALDIMNTIWEPEQIIEED